MATEPVTYRVSPEVDAELKRLGRVYGGVDRALRTLLKLSLDNVTTRAIVPKRILDGGEDSNQPIAETHAKRFERPMRQKGDKTR